MTRIRVFLADDHAIVRQGLRTLIDSQPDMEVVGEASDGVQTVDGVLRLGPDVAVIDVSMPGLAGTEAAARIRLDRPEVRILALSAHEDAGYVRRMLEAGAAGYVVKRAAVEDLVRAVRVVMGGEKYLDPAVAGTILAELSGGARGVPSSRAELSDREAEVLRLIARGHAMKRVAAELDVGVRTVETYKARAMEKLGLRSRADLVRFASGRGWLADG